MHPTPSTTTRRTASVLFVAVTLAACGGDDSGGSTTAAPAAPDTAAPAVPDTVIEVTAVDYAYQGLPGTVAAGTRIQLVNAATAELHELVAFRLPDDDPRPVGELLSLPPDELAPLFAGEPATVLLATAGGEMIPAVGDGMLAEPGRYAIICAIPTGADPEEYLAAAASGDGPPQVDGGPPHFVNGMWAELVVE